MAVLGGAVLRRETSGAACLLAGGALYLVGTFLVTMVFNVPLNNSLAALDPTDPDGARRWADYVRRWTAWNHVRTAAALGAEVSFILAIGC